jgi:hypothetical protein
VWLVVSALQFCLMEKEDSVSKVEQPRFQATSLGLLAALALLADGMFQDHLLFRDAFST